MKTALKKRLNLYVVFVILPQQFIMEVLEQ